MVEPNAGQPDRTSKSAATFGKALIVGVCLAFAMVLMTDQEFSLPAALQQKVQFTRLHDDGKYSGYADPVTGNVFDQSSYKKPVLGHWVYTGPVPVWLSGKQYLSTYGTDDVDAGKFLGHTKSQIAEAPSLVDAFGIDGNVFASDYKAPKDNIHIAVAQIHCANSDCSDDGQSKGKGAVASIEAAAGEVAKDISKITLPDNEAAMSAKRVQLKQAAQKAQLTQLTYGESDESNVYDPEHYSRPLEGHWVDVGSKGVKHWATGSEMVSKYGTDDPTKLKGKGHTAYQEAKSPSLVSAFGIDSNVFASNYQKPQAWTSNDHIGVAMVHYDGPSAAAGPSAASADPAIGKAAVQTAIKGPTDPAPRIQNPF